MKGELAYFWGIYGEAELYLGLEEQRQNTFRENAFRKLFQGFVENNEFILREQGSTDPQGAPLSLSQNMLGIKSKLPFHVMTFASKSI